MIAGLMQVAIAQFLERPFHHEGFVTISSLFGKNVGNPVC